MASAAVLGAIGFGLLLREPPRGPDPLPGRALAARVERQLEADRPRLALSPGHYGLVFPIEPADLDAFMEQIRVYGDADEVVLGTDRGFESHGGGILALLLDHWRPEGRAAALEDRFPFVGRPDGVALATIFASHLREIVVPESGLPRIRFGASGALGPIPPVETDAYSLLRLLATRGADLDARWETFGGQETSAATLLESARAHYLAGSDAPGEPADHSELHLVEILLAASARTGSDPDPVKRRFLDAELARREFDPEARTERLGHYAESLGVLVADPRVHWSDADRERVREWLAWLEANEFRAPADVAPRELAHLLRGLRLVRTNEGHLRAGV
ncbi:MAG TPA: hypothetical protein VKB65_13075 [Myxococcota bacterium]|nr:hypothetical protein [Myxococcota bacterium]